MCKEHVCISGGLYVVCMGMDVGPQSYVCVWFFVCVKVCIPTLVYLKVYHRCWWAGVHVAKPASIFQVWVCVWCGSVCM